MATANARSEARSVSVRSVAISLHAFLFHVPGMPRRKLCFHPPVDYKEPELEQQPHHNFHIWTALSPVASENLSAFTGKVRAFDTYRDHSMSTTTFDNDD